MDKKPLAVFIHYGNVFGVTLEQYLKAEDETVTAFARRAGLTVASASRYKTGQRTPDGRAMQIIATATGGRVTANDFYGLRLPRRAPRHDPHSKAS